MGVHTKKNDEKAPHLSAILLAVAVCRYNTKRIAQFRAATEATGCCHWASTAADMWNWSRIVIGHGIMAGTYLAKCRDSQYSQSQMYAGDRQLRGHSKACEPQDSKGDGKDTSIAMYRLSYVERLDPSTRATIHQLLKVSCWNHCRHMRMYVFGLIMTSFLSDRVFRLSYSLQTIDIFWKYTCITRSRRILREHNVLIIGWDLI